MTAEINLHGRKYQVDLSKGTSLAITLSPDGPRAWYVPPMRIEPVRNENFTGSVAEGGGVNFRDISFNPHGHGTHTESVAHIRKDVAPTIAETVRRYWFTSQIISIEPEIYSGAEEDHIKPGDRVIMPGQVEPLISAPVPEAVIFRTLPNDQAKHKRNYSDTNPAFFHPDALLALRKAGVLHLLTDLPSVDRESDGGKLLGHRAWWGEKPESYAGRTISEMIFAPDHLDDGPYLLNLQVLPWENDASPSNPVVYPLGEAVPRHRRS